MKNLLTVIIILFLQSCASFYAPKKEIDCSLIDQEINMRQLLFKKLDKQEILRRSKIDVPSSSALNELSVFSEIVNSVKKAPENAKIISVDLRHYRSAALGNIIISNISGSAGLKTAIHSSKYSQGFFPMINFGDDFISIFPATTNKLFKNQRILRGDLKDVEIVINISGSGSTMGNMKFTKGQKFSLIADNIKEPYSLDLRENSNLQFHLGKKWIMPVYSIKNSKIKSGKDTAGIYWFVDNTKTKGIDITKFNKSEVRCYKDENGAKF